MCALDSGVTKNAKIQKIMSEISVECLENCPQYQLSCQGRDIITKNLETTKNTAKTLQNLCT